MEEKISDSFRQEEWTETIQPTSGIFDFQLREVWRYRDLLVLFVKRDFIAKYKQTILGPLWHFIQPILSTAISVLLFNVVAKIPTNGFHPALFQMSGIIIWNYFSTCLIACSAVFTANASIFGKVYFPRLIMPLSIIISSIVQFLIQFLLLVVAMLYYSITTEWVYITVNVYWLLLPLYILIMAGIGLGAGIIISSLTTKYRDFAVLLTFGVQLLMYASAVNYPLETLSEENPKLYAVLQWNPLAAVTDGFRNTLLGGKVDLQLLVYPIFFMILVLFGGIVFFNRVEKSFMDTV
jgi:lipopolysaccharide transport system permease protein